MKTKTLVALVLSLLLVVGAANESAAQTQCKKCVHVSGDIYTCESGFQFGYWTCTPLGNGCLLGETCPYTFARGDGRTQLRSKARDARRISTVPVPITTVAALSQGRDVSRACNGRIIDRHYSGVVSARLRFESRLLLV